MNGRVCKLTIAAVASNPQTLPWSIVRTVLRQLADDPRGPRHSRLHRMVRETVQQALADLPAQDSPYRLEQAVDAYRALIDGRLRGEAHWLESQAVYEVLLKYFLAASQDSGAGEAQLAVHWLCGEPITAKDAAALGFACATENEHAPAWLSDLQSARQVLAAVLELASLGNWTLVLEIEDSENWTSGHAQALAEFLAPLARYSNNLRVVAAGAAETKCPAARHAAISGEVEDGEAVEILGVLRARRSRDESREKSESRAFEYAAFTATALMFVAVLAVLWQRMAGAEDSPPIAQQIQKDPGNPGNGEAAQVTEGHHDHSESTGKLAPDAVATPQNSPPAVPSLPGQLIVQSEVVRKEVPALPRVRGPPASAVSPDQPSPARTAAAARGADSQTPGSSLRQPSRETGVSAEVLVPVARGRQPAAARPGVEVSPANPTAAASAQLAQLSQQEPVAIVASEELERLLADAWGLVQRNEPDAARIRLEQARKVSEGDPRAEFSLGLLDGIYGRDWGSAEKRFADCLRRAPRNVACLNNLAVAKVHNKRLADAVKHWKTIVDQGGATPEVAQNLGRVRHLLKQGELPPSQALAKSVDLLYTEAAVATQKSSNPLGGFSLMPLLLEDGRTVGMSDARRMVVVPLPAPASTPSSSRRPSFGPVASPTIPANHREAGGPVRPVQPVASPYSPSYPQAYPQNYQRPGPTYPSR